MSLIASAVMGYARARRRLQRGAAKDAHDPGLQFVAEHAPGKSFADVGGMYGVDGEVAFRAERAGASAVTLFDAGEPSARFLQRAKSEGSRIRCVQGDLEDPASVQEVGRHQIVWCAGVIYHTPNPVRQLMHLREMTSEFLVLSSATIPEIPGLPHACVYYPYLDADDRRPFARGLRDPASALAVGTPFDDRPMYGPGNFWWGITPSALRAMLRTARFEVVADIGQRLYPWGSQLIARPIDLDPSLPPVEYFRQRGERLRAGRPMPFDGYYDKGPNAVATEADAFPDMAGIPAPDISAAPIAWLRRRLRR